MNDTSILEARVRQLERGQRWLILVSVAVAVCLTASVLLRTIWVPREVSAQRFMLKDAAGRIRGEWGPTDVLAGEINGITQHASATCLHLVGQKAAGVDLCAPWGPYGGPGLRMSEESGASLHVVLDAYTVSILGRASRTNAANRAAFVLGAWSDGASVGVTDKGGHGTYVRGDGLTILDSKRAVVYSTPGTIAPDR